MSIFDSIKVNNCSNYKAILQLSSVGVGGNVIDKKHCWCNCSFYWESSFHFIIQNNKSNEYFLLLSKDPRDSTLRTMILLIFVLFSCEMVTMDRWSNTREKRGIRLLRSYSTRKKHKLCEMFIPIAKEHSFYPPSLISWRFARTPPHLLVLDYNLNIFLVRIRPPLALHIDY